MKKLHIETDTKKILGWYATDISYPNSPLGLIEISEEEWQEAININANCYENGKFIIKDFRTHDEIYKTTIPNSITMRQARLYLYSVDKLEDVETIVQTRKDWQIEWEYTSEVERSSLLISTIKDKLGLSDIEVDDMFIAASKL